MEPWPYVSVGRHLAGGIPASADRIIDRAASRFLLGFSLGIKLVRGFLQECVERFAVRLCAYEAGDARTGAGCLETRFRNVVISQFLGVRKPVAIIVEPAALEARSMRAR
jgi:hypothetical protein